MSMSTLKTKLSLATTLEERLDIIDEIKELKAKRKRLKKEKIDGYLNNPSNFVLHKKNNNTITLDDFLQKPTQINQCCNREMIEDDGMIVCLSCGRFYPYLVKYENNREQPLELTKIAYTRISHFTEVLKCIQGKEAIRIPDEIIHIIKEAIFKEKINKVTPDFIKTVLKKHNLNKYFNHTIKILHHLNIPPPIYTKEFEDKLCHMFMLIQTPYSIVCPNDKSNFLNYYFVLSKMVHILGAPPYPAPIMKNKLKRMEQEDIWKKICKIVGW